MRAPEWMPPVPAAVLAGVIVGLAVTAVLLLVPVHVNFGDDPLLRLQGFDRQRSFLTTSVSCGSAPSNLVPVEGTRSLYEVARDDACHRAGVRRVWVALAAGSFLLVGSLLGVVATGASLRLGHAGQRF